MPVTVVVEAADRDPVRVEASGPLTGVDLDLLPDGPCVVQISNPLRPADHERLGRWFESHPDAELRAYGQLPENLDFLVHYPRLDRFTLDGSDHTITDATGLRHLPETLHSLAIDIGVRCDLEVLARFRELRNLRLVGVRQGPEALAGLPVRELHLSGLTTLEGIETLPGVATLRLNSVTADLGPLRALEHVTDLTLVLGGCKDLTPLAQLEGLHRFEACRVRGLADVSPVLGEHLEELYLAHLPQVTAFPPLNRAHALRRITLEHMRGIADLATFGEAPALRELALVEMEHLEPRNLATLAGHPTLATVSIGLGSNRKNLAARDLIRIPGDYGGHPWPPLSA
jgi:hypothetical protein